MAERDSRPDIRWFSVFADVPASLLDEACTFWSAVTGARPGPAAGDAGQYIPLVPPDGDRYLWLQRVDRAEPGWHLDLHLADPADGARSAQDLGAKLTRDDGDLVVLSTPAGLPFCLVAEEPGRIRTPSAPGSWPEGRSAFDQLCLDLPARAFESECDFWAELTGWPRLGRRDDTPEFDRLDVPTELPVQLLLQRLGEDDTGGIHAHADLSADDRATEVARHEALGARVVRVTDGWTTLSDPVGLVYCVTDRRPGVRYTRDTPGA